MSPKKEDFFSLDPEHVDPARVKREREKARKLRKSQWWLSQLSKGICHYCKRSYPATQLTMDHVLPIARGGTSTQGNIVPACSSCNRDKKLRMPADDAFDELEREKQAKGRSSTED